MTELRITWTRELRGASVGLGVGEGSAHLAILPTAPCDSAGLRLTHHSLMPPPCPAGSRTEVSGACGKAEALALSRSSCQRGRDLCAAAAPASGLGGLMTLLLEES